VSNVSVPNKPLTGILAQIRAQFEAINDHQGVHACEIAQVEMAHNDGPAAVLAAIRTPLKRLAKAGGLLGIDVIGLELMLTAARLEDSRLRDSTVQLLVHTGRPDVVRRIVAGLVEEAEHQTQSDHPQMAHQICRYALELAVKNGDFESGAMALGTLSRVHDTVGENGLAILCLVQAAAYLESAGDPVEARNLREVLVYRLQEESIDAPALPALEEAVLLLSKSGDAFSTSAICVALSHHQMAHQRPKAAIRTLELGLSLVLTLQSHAIEIGLHECLVDAYEAVDDMDLAKSHRAKAKLLRMAEE
jgi:hypothetical protein